MYIERLTEYLHVERDQIVAILPRETEEGKPRKNAPFAVSGFFRDSAEIDQFVGGLGEIESPKYHPCA